MNPATAGSASPGLSLDQAPPILVPLRFFLTAPLFGLLAAVTLLWAGPQAWDTRWSPAILAATHFMTLGFLTMVMMGALMQMLPVLASAKIPRPRLTSTGVHLLFVGGTLLLGAGLLTASAPWLRLSLFLLLPAFGIFFAAVFHGLWHARVTGPTVSGMRLSATALGITVALGAVLAAGYAWGWDVRSAWLINTHLAWGLLGWVGLLVMAVGFQVVPMFQMTPDYPAVITRWLTRLMFMALIAWSGAGLLPGQWQLPVAAVLALGYTAFSAITLALQQRRRRRVPDVSVLFWRTAMASLLAAAVLWSANQAWPGGNPAHAALLPGVLMIVGFGVSTVNGMLYKIVPFLVWLHLQANGGRGRLTHMKEIIPDHRTRRQFRLHLASLAFLIGATRVPEYCAYPAALLFALSCLLLWINLFNACRMYRRLTSPGTGTGAAC